MDFYGAWVNLDTSRLAPGIKITHGIFLKLDLFVFTERALKNTPSVHFYLSATFSPLKKLLLIAPKELESFSNLSKRVLIQ